MKSFRATGLQSLILAGGFIFGQLPLTAETAADSEFVKMDTNGDGKVSADEHAAAAKIMFGMMDANADGKVTAAEMDAAHERVTGEKSKASDLSAAGKIKVIDSDGDGILIAAEHAAGSSAMFKKMDTDNDGFLTKAELAAGHAAMTKKP